MHRHHCHPMEVNDERIRLLAGKCKAWEVEEDLLLVETADREWREGMMRKDHIVAISPFFPHRSSEALRKRLQGLKWGPPGTSREERDTACTSVALEGHATGDLFPCRFRLPWA